MSEYRGNALERKEPEKPYIDRWEQWADQVHSYRLIRSIRPLVEADIADAQRRGEDLTEEQIDSLIARYLGQDKPGQVE
mgnify:CR=1 FL=1